MRSNGSCSKLQADIALVALLKACAKQKDLRKGSRLHADIIVGGLLSKNTFVGSSLVHLYAQCDELAKAQQVFHELSVRDVVSWTSLIKGYAQFGHGDEAISCFEDMKLEGFSPDAVTFACVLHACGDAGAMRKGEEIHVEIERMGFLQKDVVLANALLDMYAKCSALARAQQVFDSLRFKDVVSWNALIAGYAHHGYGSEAIDCFDRMQDEGPSPNAVTLLGILQACGVARAAEKGSEAHTEIARKGLLRGHSLLGNALVDMYAKCAELRKAKEVFDTLPVRSTVSWTTLIAGYGQHGYDEEAFACFERMLSEGISADGLTYAWIVKACGSIGSLDMGKQIHTEVARKGFMEQDHVLGNAVVDMYVKCGALSMAHQVFEELPIQGVVSWTALITGHFAHGHNEAALDCFEAMRRDGFNPDAVLLLCILQISGTLGATHKGKELHAVVVKEGLLANDHGLGNALVDMYSKCGAAGKAQAVFDDLSFRDVVSWTTLMSGYGLIGKHEIVFSLLNKMIREGIDPNRVTLIVVLNSCTDLGLLTDGQTYFEAMTSNYGIIPTLEHYTCMVDLFGRAGHLDKAMDVVRKISLPEYFPMWDALLGVCRKWGNTKLGRFVFEQAVNLQEMPPPPTVACAR